MEVQRGGCQRWGKKEAKPRASCHGGVSLRRGQQVHLLHHLDGIVRDPDFDDSKLVRLEVGRGGGKRKKNERRGRKKSKRGLGPSKDG